MVKKQQMRWTPRGAHLLLQVRTRELNDELRDIFCRWYPGMVPVRQPSLKKRRSPRFEMLSHHAVRGDDVGVGDRARLRGDAPRAGVIGPRPYALRCVYRGTENPAGASQGPPVRDGAGLVAWQINVIVSRFSLRYGARASLAAQAAARDTRRNISFGSWPAAAAFAGEQACIQRK